MKYERVLFVCLITAVLHFLRAAPAQECDPARPVDAHFWLYNAPRHLRPGEEFTCGLLVKTNYPAQGYRFLIDFDEELYELLGAEKVHRRPDGKPFEEEVLILDSENRVPNTGDVSLEEGTIEGRFVFSATDRSFDLPTGTTRVLDFGFRVRPETTSHGKSIRFEYRGDPRTTLPPPNAILACGLDVGEYSARPHHLQPHEDGVLIIQPGDCDPGNLPPDIDVAFRLQDVAGTRGGEVRVPVFMEANYAVLGYTFSIDFDEEALEAKGVEMVYRRPDGTPWRLQRMFLDNQNLTAGNGGIDEGFMAGAVIFDTLSYDWALPGGDEREVMNLLFTIRPGLQGSSTAIRFKDGALPPNTGSFKNFAFICGETASPEEVRSFIFVDGKVGVIDEITIFARGDSNGDQRVELTDAIFTLSHLFMEGHPPGCYDAADANDDGSVDVSDPVTTIGHLFLGLGALPAPGIIPGADPTPDQLGCLAAPR